MSLKDSSRQAFLQELYNRAEGDFEVQISMYDIGADLGLEKNDAAAIGQDLFIEGLAEMKTLSGGMGITQKGLEALGIKITPKNETRYFRLGNGPVLDDQGKKAVHELLNKIRADLYGYSLNCCGQIVIPRTNIRIFYLVFPLTMVF